MSKSRDLLPLVLCTIMGIVVGNATFGPALRDQQKKRLEEEEGRPKNSNDSTSTSRLGSPHLPGKSNSAEAAKPSQDQVGSPAAGSAWPGLGLWAWTEQGRSISEHTKKSDE